MALYNEKTDIRQCRYQFKKVQLVGSGGSVNIDTWKIKHFQIIEDFENNVFPIFKICMILESSVYYKILNNKDSGRLFLRIDAFYQSVGKEGASGASREFINGNFNIVLDDNTADMLYSQKVVSNKESYTSVIKDNTNVLKDIDNEVTFYLFRTDAIEGLKVNNVNTILHDATVTDAVAILSSKANLKNILFAPPDNNTRYESLLIPPLSVLKAYLFLDSYYGIYKTGSIIYFGFNTTYIIPFTGECKAWKSGESKKTVVIVPKTSNVAHATVLGELKSSSAGGNSIIADYSSVNIENKTLSNNYIAGNDSQVLDAYQGNVTVTEAKTVTKNNKNSTRMIENSTENEFAGTMYVAQSSSSSVVINLQMRDILITALTPNKEFEIIFEESKYADQYKGKYVLSNCIHNFTNMGETFVVDSTAKFRRSGGTIGGSGFRNAVPSGSVPGL